jgi:hypothetical protein
LTTTFMTSPLLQAICPDAMLRKQVEVEPEQLEGVQLGFNPAGD